MGFILTSCDVRWERDALRLTGRFTCVCGRNERFNFTIEVDEIALDPAKLLREYGAFSHEHLISDGFTVEEALNITQRGEAYDLAHQR